MLSTISYIANVYPSMPVSLLGIEKVVWSEIWKIQEMFKQINKLVCLKIIMKNDSIVLPQIHATVFLSFPQLVGTQFIWMDTFRYPFHHDTHNILLSVKIGRHWLQFWLVFFVLLLFFDTVHRLTPCFWVTVAKPFSTSPVWVYCGPFHVARANVAGCPFLPKWSFSVHFSTHFCRISSCKICLNISKFSSYRRLFEYLETSIFPHNFIDISKFSFSLKVH